DGTGRLIQPARPTVSGQISRDNQVACHPSAAAFGMKPMPTSISRPLAAALAFTATVQAAGPTVATLPPVPARHGFAGAFAGIHKGHLLAGGGANVPDGVMPWDGGKKVWHDRVFALDLQKAGAVWREAGKLPSRNGY